MLGNVKSEANTEMQFDIKKFNIMLMAIFVTLIYTYILFTCNVLQLIHERICE